MYRISMTELVILLAACVTCGSVVSRGMSRDLPLLSIEAPHPEAVEPPKPVAKKTAPVVTARTETNTGVRR